MTVLALPLLILASKGPDRLAQQFVNPPAEARPWVYWYFMEGNITREGITADLEAMRKAGLGGGIFLEVNIGIPKGPVRYMSPEWQKLVRFAISEADRLGLGIDFGTGPGWCGSGGPWVTTDQAMQHLVSSATEVQGPRHFQSKLAQPKPRTPFFGMGSLTPALQKEWADYDRDEVVVAVPASKTPGLSDLDGKSLVYRGAFSSQPGVPPYLLPEKRTVKSAIPANRVIDLTGRFHRDGSLDWNVPAGKWTILRFGRTLTGQTSRPAPDAGLGFETDKFETAGISAHLDHFIDPILPAKPHPGRGLTALHWDSWEMGAQNWSPHFRSLFRQKRGYDPLPYLPVMAGKIVDSVDVSERFLWDLRQTAQELVIENHLGTIKQKAKKNGLNLSLEPYDLNPTSDLALGGIADEPMAEFWSRGYGFRTEFSAFEAVSVAHTMGRPVVGAESFTSDDRDGWLQHPASMKEQGDWALATGINKFYFHRYEHQPKLDQFPGMTMGPYGVHWERTQTWWNMVPAYHAYLTRCQNLLRQGLPVADILYLTAEGAPNVFQAPASATVGDLPDRRGYNFDGCAPDALLTRASVKDGRIVFPDGMSYRVLVLPRRDTMTPALLKKVKSLVEAGATVVGNLPRRSPSLVGYPRCDAEINRLAKEPWAQKLIPDRAETTPVVTLNDARWIWNSEADPANAAALGTHRFTKELLLPIGRKIASATIAVTADNTFHFKVNGKTALEGTDFHQVHVFDIASLLTSGANQLSVEVSNDGDKPNPAGLLASLDIRFADGGHLRFATDATWTVDGAPSKELGPWDMAPWSLTAASLPQPSLYPSYETVAGLLARRGIAPDLQSDDQLRYNHRRTKDGDLYFVANRNATELTLDARFRVTGRQPEWWDPKTGERRNLPQFKTVGPTTIIPLRLDPFQSGFVVFRHPGKPAKSTNFPTLKPVQTIPGPWLVNFDPKFGGPSGANFDTLIDWTTRPEEAIRHFSGKAVYRTTFDAPYPADTLSLGTVANMAQVRLNGQDLGVAWSTPWQLHIPAGLLRKQGNYLEITVANLWANRLIGDAALPAEKRITQTTWSPFHPDSPLQPSGLMGPVRLLKTVASASRR